ncbi:polysaccharide biosynthesis/export family protein [Candidatus Nitrosacidococcus tergens]|uniref:Polysaccharide export protein n=1 Tax=Candidatus Nitrosacidococcus tergens TaxID=553981 RepID=A0A7G1Q9L3_9GAMM|nr:polysaccharide biosynthesis/export family protein [Candidatus Nitrosacidococcus tergens]CAB1275826.1 Polysaccharide export protein [Candidatus Nitrosacidococcus tergens]
MRAIFSCFFVSLFLISCGTHNTYQKKSLSSHIETEKATIYTDFIADKSKLSITNLEKSLNQHDYQIGPSDVLSVDVFQVEEISEEEIVVDNGGTISLPLIGSIQAAGLTPDELEANITKILGEKYLQNPQVSVSIVEHISKRFTVAGEVKKPGLYPIEGPTTLVQAISAAQGEGEFADLSKVGLIRTIKGNRQMSFYNVNEIRSQTAIDPQIHANDVVIVNQSRFDVFWDELTRFFHIFVSPAAFF